MLGRAARTLGYLIAGVVGWIAVYLALTAVRLGFSLLGLVHFRWFPSLDALSPAGMVKYGGGIAAVVGATLMVALWWALGADTGRARARRVTFVVLVFGAAFIGELLTLSATAV